MRQSWGRNAVALAVFAALVVLGGCGGSSGETDTETVTVGGGDELTKSEWIAKADAICAQEQRQEKPLKAEFESRRQEPEQSPEQLKALADTTRELLRLVSNEVGDLRQLQPPAADRETVEEMLMTVDGSVPLGEEFADAIEAGDSAEIEATAQRIEQNSAKGQGLAQGYGLKVCGSGE